MNTRTVRLMLSSLLFALVVSGGIGPLSTAVAADHDEAPLVTVDMGLNANDFYAFVRPGMGVTPASVLAVAGFPADPLTFNDADTIIHFDQFIGPGMGSGTVGFGFSAYRFHSTQPLTLSFSDGSTTEFDVEVIDSPTMPSTGMVQFFENSAATGGSVAIDITLYLLVIFTDRATGEVTVVDGGTENLPIQVEGSGSYSYDCPPDLLSIAGVTADFCLGHFPGASSVFTTTLIDVNNTSNPAVEWRVRPATALENQPPVLDPIGPQDVDEGSTTTITFNASDPEGDSLAFSIQNQPSYSQFVDNGDGTASLTVTPPAGSGSDIFDVTVTVTDDGSPPLSDQETFTLSVRLNPENAPPVFAPTDDITVSELESTTISNFVTATDPERDAITLSVSGLPTACTLVEVPSEPGTLIADLRCDADVMPGIYTVTLTADDRNGGVASDTFTITVAPFLDTGGDQTVTQGDQITLTPATSSGSTIDFDFDGDGVFETPGPTAIFDASSRTPGDYEVFVRATKNGATATDTIMITVLQAPDNSPPILSDINDVSLNEGQASTLLIEGSDPDGDNLVFTISNQPGFATFSDFNNGTGAFSFQPGYSDAGIYTVSVLVSEVDDSNQFDEDTFTITVLNVNQDPNLDPIDDVTVNEGGTAAVTINSSDPDPGDTLTLTSDGPGFTQLSDNGDGSGSLTISPGTQDAGTYSVTVTVTDNGSPSLSAEDTFTIVVLPVNQNPDLDPINDVTVNEGETLTVAINGGDNDGDAVVLSADLPIFASLTDNGDGTGNISLSPNVDDAGIYTVAVMLSDDGNPSLSDSETFTVTIINVNQPPLLGSVPDLTIDEGDSGTIALSASDPDGDDISISGDVPPFCLINDNGDGSADLQCDPGPDDAGDYPGVILATDNGDPALIDSATLTINVLNVNRSPNIESVSGQTTVNEGGTTTIAVMASDPDGDNLTMTLENNPSFCAIVDNGNGMATITCNPGFDDSGTHTFTVFANDDASPDPRSSGTQITILVNDVNRSPALDAIDDQQVVEDGELFGTFTATDPDGDSVTLSAPGLPGFCTLTDNGDGSAFFECNPSIGDAGEYTVTITASDGVLQSTQTFKITVQPKVAAGGPYNGTLGENVQLAGECVSCQDQSGNVSFTWDLDSDGVFDNAIGFVPIVSTLLLGPGTFTIAAEGCVPDTTNCSTDTTTITIVDANRPPLLEEIGPQKVNEEDILDKPLFASDPDGDQVTISGIGLPAFCQIDLTGDGEVYLLCSPGPEDAGVYTFTIVAQDDGDPAAQVSETVTLTVCPTSDAGGPYTVVQGGTTTVAATGPVTREYNWDFDGDGIFETHGQTATFYANTLSPGTYPIQLRACLSGTSLCNFDDAEVIVEGPSIETYDELESLVRATVESPFAQRLLTTTLNLAQYFDEQLGLGDAASVLLRAFIRLVETFTPVLIDSTDAQQLIDFAEFLIDGLDD